MMHCTSTFKQQKPALAEGYMSSDESSDGDFEPPVKAAAAEPGNSPDLAAEDSGSGSSEDEGAAAAAASKRKKAPQSSDSDSAASGSDEEGEADRPKPKKKRLRKSGSGLTSKKAKALFDDEAQVSGSESGDDEEGSEDENEYQVDGFVVPEGEDDEGRKSGKRRKKKVHKRLRRVRDVAGPDEDDLELVREAQMRAGNGGFDDADARQRERERQEGLEARNAKDLASQLFDGDASDDEAAAALAAARAAAGGSSSDVLQQQQQPKRGLREQDYNSEDDDFIEDDIGGMYNQ
eukprot:20802-Heterococcus_DN1.PRE.1